jgi:hypothetical protein
MSEPSEPSPNPQSTGAVPDDDLQSALFLDLVAQHAEMAMMFLGRVPHPHTGKTVLDLQTACLFIGQLEMLEAKTKGNLNAREQGLLKQSLMATRMAFVEAVEAGPAKESAGSESAAAPGQPAAPASPEQAQEASADATEEERKKFVKKY